MNLPKVTVIIPTYNRAHYLGMAIQSVFEQTFDDLELIVVDDGSTDNTRELVGRIRDRRFRYLYQEHRGTSAARNAGIRNARGNYVAWLDSDDLWLPDMLAVEVPVLDGRPEIGLVYAQGQGMDKDGKLLAVTRGMPERYPGDSFRSMLWGDCTYHDTVVLRRSCFDRVGLFDESFRTIEDWDMWLRVARHYPFAYIDRVVAKFRLHDGNITGSSSPLFAEHLDGRQWVLDKAFAAEELMPSIAAVRPIAYRNVYTEAGFCWLAAGRLPNALHSFGRALRTEANPFVTLARIVWFVLVWKFFNRFSWGRRFVETTADLRRQWRLRKGIRNRPLSQRLH